MRVCVLGAGAIGGYVGGCLARGGVDVVFLARGAQLAALRERGLMVHTPQEEFRVAVRATDDPETIRDADLIVFSVKTYDTDQASRLAARMLAPDGVVLTLQNGLDPQRGFEGVIDENRILRGAPFILSALTAPGVVTRMSGGARVVFGGGEARRGRDVLALLQTPGLQADLTDAIGTVLWERWVVACPVNGVTAALRLSLGAVMESSEGRAMFIGAAEEVLALGTRMGITFPRDFVQKAVAQVETLPKHAESSLHRDLMSGRKLELDALNAGVVALGRTHGVPTPVNARVTDLLRPHMFGTGTGPR